MNLYKGDKPLFKHDCDKCTFIGNETVVADKKRVGVDMYYCGDLNAVDQYKATFIIRYSDEPSDYASMDIGTLLQSLSNTDLANFAKRLFKIQTVRLNIDEEIV